MNPMAMDLATLFLSVQVARSTLTDAFATVRNYLQEREKDLFMRYKITGSQQVLDDIIKLKDGARRLGEVFEKMNLTLTAGIYAAAGLRKAFDWVSGVADKFDALNSRLLKFQTTMEAFGTKDKAFFGQMKEQIDALVREGPMKLEQAEDMMRRMATKLGSGFSANQVGRAMKEAIGFSNALNVSIEEGIASIGQMYRLQQTAAENPAFREEAQSLAQRHHRQIMRAFPAAFAGAVTPQEQQLRFQALLLEHYKANQMAVTDYRRGLIDLSNSATQMGRKLTEAFGPAAQVFLQVWFVALKAVNYVIGLVAEAMKIAPIKYFLEGLAAIAGIATVLVTTFAVWKLTLFAVSTGMIQLVATLVKAGAAILARGVPSLVTYIAVNWSVVTAQLAVLLSSPWGWAFAAVAIGAIAAICVGIGKYVSVLQDAYAAQLKVAEGQEKLGEDADMPAPIQNPGRFMGFQEYREQLFRESYNQTYKTDTKQRRPEERTASAAERIQAMMDEERRSRRTDEPARAEVRLT